MKINNEEDFRRALPFIGMEKLELKLVSADADFSSVGVPREIIRTDEDYQRFTKIMKEAFNPNDVLFIPIQSARLEFVYCPDHFKKLLVQAFKALEEFQWRHEVAAR